MRPILITGASGTLGNAFRRVAARRAITTIGCTRRELDVTDASAVSRMLDDHMPWAVVNAAGYVRVDAAELAEQECYQANTTGPAVLARACAARAVALLTFSSDLVFDGCTDTPYVESDRPSPLSVYGRSKVEAECRVRSVDPAALIVRTSAFFGPWDDHNFAVAAVNAGRRGRPQLVPADITVSATFLPDLVDACLDLLIDGASGIWHLANVGAATWAELACLAAETAGAPAPLVTSASPATLGWLAQRPRYSALGTERGMLLPPLADALARWGEMIRAA